MQIEFTYAEQVAIKDVMDSERWFCLSISYGENGHKVFIDGKEVKSGVLE